MTEPDAYWAANNPYALKETTDLLNGGKTSYAEDQAYRLRYCSFCHRTRPQRKVEVVLIRERSRLLQKRSKQTKVEEIEESLRGTQRQVFYRCRTGACRTAQRRLGYRDDPNPSPPP